MNGLLDLTNPYTVANASGVQLQVMDVNGSLPAALMLAGTTATRKVAVRVAGGCSGMSDGDKLDMLEYFREAFRGYQGVIWSGGTRSVRDGMIDPMVTEVPGVIARDNPGAIALGTAPRTDGLRLVGDSMLALDDHGTIVNPAQAYVLLVQSGTDDPMGWDGDLDAAAKITQLWINHGNFQGAGLVSWNGGSVTRKEIEASISAGRPTFLVERSGRVTDEMIGAYIAGDLAFTMDGPNSPIVVVSRDDPAMLRRGLIDFGLIVPR